MRRNYFNFLSFNEHPRDENCRIHVLMDLISTFRTAELLIMSRNPFTSAHHAELIISMSVRQCE